MSSLPIITSDPVCLGYETTYLTDNVVHTVVTRPASSVKITRQGAGVYRFDPPFGVNMFWATVDVKRGKVTGGRAEGNFCSNLFIRVSTDGTMTLVADVLYPPANVPKSFSLFSFRVGRLNSDE